MKKILILTALFFSWSSIILPPLTTAGDYSATEPGSGIRETAHDLRPGEGNDGWDYRSLYQKMYDNESIVTLTGIVHAVEEVTPRREMSPGIQLKVKTEEETLSVHLGPAWFIKEQDMQVIKGDPVEIKGSQVLFDGEPVVMAAEMKRGEEALALRDRNGFPLWPGKR
jgi:hypothetical protein